MAGIPLGDRWSIDFPKCVGCGTTERIHQARGKCRRCVSKDIWADPVRRARKEMQQKKWRDTHPETVSAIARRQRIKMYPEREYKKKLLGVDSLWEITKGNCRWEACRSGHSKIYSCGLCGACYARLKRTPNWPQVKELYTMINP